jgi:hypothetical protein
MDIFTLALAPGQASFFLHPGVEGNQIGNHVGKTRIKP